MSALIIQSIASVIILAVIALAIYGTIRLFGGFND